METKRTVQVTSLGSDANFHLVQRNVLHIKGVGINITLEVSCLVGGVANSELLVSVVILKKVKGMIRVVVGCSSPAAADIVSHRNRKEVIFCPFLLLGPSNRRMEKVQKIERRAIHTANRSGKSDQLKQSADTDTRYYLFTRRSKCAFVHS